MNKRLIEYYCKQKDWWRNMDNIVINFRHMSEATLNLAHMTTPKQRIDRMGCFWMVK